MQVLNVNFSLDLKIGTGTAERTFQMSRFLARYPGLNCTVLTLDLGLSAERINALSPANAIVLGCLWKRFSVPRPCWTVIRELVKKADVVHLMGHWSVLNAFVYIAIRLSNKPYVVCPAGGLPMFGRSRWLKWIYNAVVGRAIIRNASAWIAVTEGEFLHFQKYGIPSSKVSVIPNGVCNEDFPTVDVKEFLERRKLPDVPLILFMGRLNLIKGPDILLRAFAIVQRRFENHHLVFAGGDGGMLTKLREMVEQQGLSNSVHFLGHIDGHDKSAAYRSAKLLVVPSRQEAMSIVALEAAICGTPVLLTDQCGFSQISAVDPRLEVPATESGIADGLVLLLSDPKLLEELCVAWRSFVEQKYEWDSIVQKYIHLYDVLLGQPLRAQ